MKLKMLTFAVAVIAASAKAVTITNTSPLPSVEVGISYSQTFGATGGTNPYSWSVVSGSPPSEFTLNSSSGVLSGTPMTAETYNFTVQVKDKNNASAQKAFALTVTSCMTWTTTNLTSGTVGQSYTYYLQNIAGGCRSPYGSWGVASGSLPPGLTLDGSNGTISGTPTTAGTYNFSVTVTDANHFITVQALSLTINPPTPPTITTTSPLPNGTVGTSYSQQFAASGGATPYSWAVASGSLPSGLSLSSGGLLSGTPTSTGTTSFSVKVTGNGASSTNAFSLTINPQTPPTITTTSPLPNGTVGTSYNQQFAASGGATPYSWAVASGSLPSGLSLSSGGLLSGTGRRSGTTSCSALPGTRWRCRIFAPKKCRPARPPSKLLRTSATGKQPIRPKRRNISANSRRRRC